MSYLINYSFLFLLAFLLPHVKGVLQFRFQVTVWLNWHLLSTTGQFMEFGVSVMLGVRVSSSEWGARWMLSGCNRVDHAGDCQHPSPCLPSVHVLSFSRPRAEPYRSPYLGSLALWCPFRFGQWKLWAKKLEGGRREVRLFLPHSLFASAPSAWPFRDFNSCRAAPLPWFQTSLGSAELLFSPCPWRPTQR